MTSILSQQQGKGVVLSEAPGYRSREAVIVTLAGAALESGTVMSKLTATGKWVPYDDVGTDGTEAASGILLGGLKAATGDVKATVLVRDCEVNRYELVGLNANAVTDLAALGVIVRGNAGAPTVSTPAL